MPRDNLSRATQRRVSTTLESATPSACSPVARWPLVPARVRVGPCVSCASPSCTVVIFEIFEAAHIGATVDDANRCSQSTKRPPTTGGGSEKRCTTPHVSPFRRHISQVDMVVASATNSSNPHTMSAEGKLVADVGCSKAKL